jgi:hypothetical protein
LATRSILRSLSAVAVAAVLTGCVTQDPYGLPPLGSPEVQHGPSTTPYYGYGYGSYSRHGYGYSPYDYYPYGYGSQYYGSGYRAQPYPSGPYCRDANRDGRCDVRRDPPDRNQEPDADVFERLRDRIDTRAGASPDVPAPTPNAVPRRPPPPPKVAPPKTPQPQGARPEAEPDSRLERPLKWRSIVIQTD